MSPGIRIGLNSLGKSLTGILRFENDLRESSITVMGDGEGDIFYAQAVGDGAASRLTSFSVGLPLGSRTTSISIQRTPRAHPVPRAFIVGFLGGEIARRSARRGCGASRNS